MRQDNTVSKRDVLRQEIVALAEQDVDAESALRAAFARFWGTAQGEPREIYDRFIGRSPAADGVRFEEVDSGPVQGWWCHPENAVQDRAILFLHGGAYIQGSPRAYRGFASQIATRARAATFALQYPLAPEHPFPAAPKTALVAYRWLTESGFSKIALVGDSAGGGLALVTLAQIAADKALTQAVAGVMFSPWTDLSQSGSSMGDPRVTEPLLNRDMIVGAARTYLGSALPRHPGASPLFGRFAGLPPLLIQVGSDEILLDDSFRFARLAANAGVPVKLEIWERLHHVFQLNSTELVSARRALDRAGEFLEKAFV